MFLKKKILILFTITFIFSIITFTFFYYKLLETMTSDSISSFLSSEMTSIQQGNFINSLSKFSRTLGSSKILKHIELSACSSEASYVIFSDGLMKNSSIPICSEDVSFEIYNYAPTLVISKQIQGTGKFLTVKASSNYYFILLFINFSLASGLFFLLSSLVESENKLNAAALRDISKKLAHDIRSPISTLNLISSKISDETIREIQISVVSQINAIANQLLDSDKGNNSVSSVNDFFVNLRLEYSVKMPTIIFQKTISRDHYLPMELINILYSSVNNFIQNSIEAGSLESEIIISLKTFNEFSEIIISDSGKGIPTEILEKLGKIQISVGKSHADSLGGSGVAIYNAKKDLLKFNSLLNIVSNVNVGTQITIKIPRLSS